MVDKPRHMILQLLRRLDSTLSELRDDIRDLKVRMTHVEEGVAGVNRRIDRLEARLDRIERRLDPVDAPR